MERSPHALFAGPGADDFGRAAGLECVEPSFFSTDARRDQLRRVQATGEETIVLDHDGQALTQAPGANAAPLDEGRKLGTVGAVALDLHGNLAAATSTGGLTNKQIGRASCRERGGQYV